MPVNGMSRDIARPFAAAMEILNPVKDPGPIVTAMLVKSDSEKLDSLTAFWIIGMIAAPCPRSMRALTVLEILPSDTTATEHEELELSIASVSIKTIKSFKWCYNFYTVAGSSAIVSFILLLQKYKL